ncbi:MAG TPA: hypothetical protein VFD98_12145 [Terracidiphilus sp.]|jgi:hypothetical protein|nr:hypothetical protein [Terracidiphilus sp.]
MARPRKTVLLHAGPESKPEIPNQEQVLGRNPAAAFIATQHGIGLDYARKKYAHEPVGAFWVSLARMVLDHLAQHPSMPPRKPPLVQ